MNKKKFIILLILLLSIFGINNVNALSTETYTNKETRYQVVIEDDANLLTEDEISKLQEEMKPLTEHGNIIFKSISVNPTSSETFALNYYHEKFDSKSGTVFLIDMDNRKIYIFSDGANYNTISTDKADIITDNVYKYASEEDYYKCASVVFNQINTILNGGKIAEPMRYISNFLLAITISFLISFIVILTSTGIKKATTQDIIANCAVNFNISNITAEKVGSHKEYSPPSSSSGSSGGGSHSSGGGGSHSSGGGGGHRF